MGREFSRRLLLLAAAGSSLVIACKDNSVDQFLSEIAPLPLSDRLKRIDQFYSQYQLTAAVAKEIVPSAWIDGYLSASGSKLTKDAIKLQISFNPNAKDNTAFSEFDTQPSTKKKSAVSANLAVLESYKTIKHPANGEEVKGIIVLRNAFTNQLVHYDSSFVDNPRLGQLMTRAGVITHALNNPTSQRCYGFSVFDIAANGTYISYFGNFDRMVSEAINYDLNQKIGLQTVFTNPGSAVMLDFLQWINSDFTSLRVWYRNSDIESVIDALGIASAKLTDRAYTKAESLSVGIQTLAGFTKGSTFLATRFPGIQSLVFDKPVKLVR
jgi:hypothetical protein